MLIALVEGPAVAGADAVLEPVDPELLLFLGEFAEMERGLDPFVFQNNLMGDVTDEDAPTDDAETGENNADAVSTADAESDAEDDDDDDDA